MIRNPAVLVESVDLSPKNLSLEGIVLSNHMPYPRLLIILLCRVEDILYFLSSSIEVEEISVESSGVIKTLNYCIDEFNIVGRLQCYQTSDEYYMNKSHGNCGRPVARDMEDGDFDISAYNDNSEKYHRTTVRRATLVKNETLTSISKPIHHLPAV